MTEEYINENRKNEPTYSTKYIGVIDGNMGILSRRNYIQAYLPIQDKIKRPMPTYYNKFREIYMKKLLQPIVLENEEKPLTKDMNLSCQISQGITFQDEVRFLLVKCLKEEEEKQVVEINRTDTLEQMETEFPYQDHNKNRSVDSTHKTDNIQNVIKHRTASQTPNGERGSRNNDVFSLAKSKSTRRKYKKKQTKKNVRGGIEHKFKPKEMERVAPSYENLSEYGKASEKSEWESKYLSPRNQNSRENEFFSPSPIPRHEYKGDLSVREMFYHKFQKKLNLTDKKKITPEIRIQQKQRMKEKQQPPAQETGPEFKYHKPTLLNMLASPLTTENKKPIGKSANYTSTNSLEPHLPSLEKKKPLGRSHTPKMHKTFLKQQKHTQKINTTICEDLSEPSHLIPLHKYSKEEEDLTIEEHTKPHSESKNFLSHSILENFSHKNLDDDNKDTLHEINENTDIHHQNARDNNGDCINQNEGQGVVSQSKITKILEHDQQNIEGGLDVECEGEQMNQGDDEGSNKPISATSSFLAKNEKVTGIPNPERYNVYVVTNYVRGKRLPYSKREKKEKKEAVSLYEIEQPALQRKGVYGCKISNRISPMPLKLFSENPATYHHQQAFIPKGSDNKDYGNKKNYKKDSERDKTENRAKNWENYHNDIMNKKKIGEKREANKSRPGSTEFDAKFPYSNKPNYTKIKKIELQMPQWDYNKFQHLAIPPEFDTKFESKKIKENRRSPKNTRKIEEMHVFLPKGMSGIPNFDEYTYGLQDHFKNYDSTCASGDHPLKFTGSGKYSKVASIDLKLFSNDKTPQDSIHHFYKHKIASAKNSSHQFSHARHAYRNTMNLQKKKISKGQEGKYQSNNSLHTLGQWEKQNEDSETTLFNENVSEKTPLIHNI